MNHPLSSPKIGELVANFALPLCSGSDLSLDSFLRNKRGAVVVFWSGICSHCVRYDSYLSEFCELVAAWNAGNTDERVRFWLWLSARKAGGYPNESCNGARTS